MPNLQRGACLNFAHFSMQFCNPGDPKGGPWPNGPPPKYAPESTQVKVFCYFTPLDVIYHQYCHGIKVGGFTVARSGYDVAIIRSFLLCCGHRRIQGGLREPGPLTQLSWGSGSELGSTKVREELEARKALKIWLLPHLWFAFYTYV